MTWEGGIPTIEIVKEKNDARKRVERKKVEERTDLDKGVERNKPTKKVKRVRKDRMNWFVILSHLYVKHTFNGLNNVDVVSKEESEHRIEICGLVVGILLLIPATIFTALLCIAVLSKPQSPMIITPKIPNEQMHDFSEQHVALIYHDGSVYDISISLNENISPSKQLLLKLPKDKTYFGFANEQQEILTFISSTLCRPITQFKFPHSIIPNSQPKMVDPMDYFSQGVQVGNLFWVSNVKQNIFISKNYDSNKELQGRGQQRIRHLRSQI